MNGMALLGLIMIVYAIAVLFMVVKKPENIWQMKKIQLFIKVLGAKGTDIFFVIFALIILMAGVYLLLTS